MDRFKTLYAMKNYQKVNEMNSKKLTLKEYRFYARAKLECYKSQTKSFGWKIIQKTNPGTYDLMQGVYFIIVLWAD